MFKLTPVFTDICFLRHELAVIPTDHSWLIGVVVVAALIGAGLGFWKQFKTSKLK